MLPCMVTTTIQAGLQIHQHTCFTNQGSQGKLETDEQRTSEQKQMNNEHLNENRAKGSNWDGVR